jgi:hypothetical protein
VCCRAVVSIPLVQNIRQVSWAQDARNASALWREMRKMGFRGQIGVVSEWARRRRLAENADHSALARTPSARSVAKCKNADKAQKFFRALILQAPK